MTRHVSALAVALLAAALAAALSSGCWPRPAGAANVLAVHSMPGKSHWNVMDAVLRALTDRGHAVTAFTSFPGAGRDNYTEHDLTVHPSLRPARGLDAAAVAENYGRTAALTANMANSTRAFCAAVLADGRMAELLRRSSDGRRPFDVVVTEPFASDCVAYEATVLGVPLVYVVPPPVPTYLERSLTGHAPNPAVVPHVLSAGGPLRTFGRRLANVALTVYCAALNWRAERRLRRTDPRPFDRPDLVGPSVTFVNTHFVTEPSRPFTPDVVQIGGIHLARPGTLPRDILEFIEDSPHGVIYFTFGSVISMKFPENIQKAFVEAIGKLPQRVLWKYEGEMKDKPKNVLTRKWFPQRDILLHPKVKLFICHGGISGIYEAVDAGVPVLGFPIYFDEPRNIGNLVEAGMAISLDLFAFNAETLFNAISELINNKKYRNNAEIVSRLFKDRPMSPSEAVVFWTEYVIRHGGAPHLKSHAINLTWYQYYLIDVIFTFLFLVLIILLAIYVSLKITYKFILKCLQKIKVKLE